MGLETLVGLGLAAAGTGLSMAGNAQSQRAMNNTAQDELLAQQQYQKRGLSAFANSAQQSTAQNAKQQMQQGQQQSLGSYQQLQAQRQPSSLQSLVSTDPITAARTGAYIGQQNTADAVNQGYGTYAVSQQLKDMAAQRQLQAIGTESQTRAQILPLQMAQAGQRGAGLNAVGSGLSALGSLAGLYGIYNSLPTLADGSLPSLAQSGRVAAESTYIPTAPIGDFGSGYGSTFGGYG